MTVTVIAFSILELHNRGFKPIMIICRPFYQFFARFRKDLNLRTSLIDAFVTFFVLSTTKLHFVSFNLLIYLYLYTPNGNTVGICLYEDPSIEFFGQTHTPYGVLAVVVLAFLIFLPVCLLLFYKMTCCQKCLAKTRLKGSVLEDLIHRFNQYYKDGSDGSVDCRWFAAFPIVFRLGALLLFSTSPALIENLYLVYLLVFSVIVVAMEPYKDEYRIYNTLEPCFYLVLTGVVAGSTGFNSATLLDERYIQLMLVLVAVTGSLPLIYLSIVSAWWTLQRVPCDIRRLRACSQDLSPDLPDRLLNSGVYK